MNTNALHIYISEDLSVAMQLHRNYGVAYSNNAMVAIVTLYIFQSDIADGEIGYQTKEEARQ